MDQGQGRYTDLGNNTGDGQLSDFNPGIRNGLFWTIPVSPDAVTIDPANGRASLVLDAVGLYDYTNAFMSIQNGTGTPAVARVDVEWTPPADIAGNTATTSSAGDEFTTTLISGDATLSFEIHYVGVSEGEAPATTLSFTSGTLADPTDRSGQHTPVGAVVGTERNGVFFRTQ